MSKAGKKRRAPGKQRGGKGGGILPVLLWSLVALLLLAAVDQFFVRVPQRQPLLGTARSFYLDLRGRLLQLGAPAPTPLHPAPTAKPAPPPEPAKKPLPATPPQNPGEHGKSVGFVYADGEGVLRFTDTLEQVPARYRKDAQPLAR